MTVGCYYPHSWGAVTESEAKAALRAMRRRLGFDPVDPLLSLDPKEGLLRITERRTSSQMVFELYANRRRHIVVKQFIRGV
jgi:hypothetical protein